MKQRSDNLKKELTSVGATKSEVNELLPIALNLKRLKNTPDLATKPIVQVERRVAWKTLIPTSLALMTGLALGIIVVIWSQTVLPGSLLYPVQKLSDNVAVSVSSSYRGMVMMKRAEQVKQLIGEHASSNLVLATLANYRTEASTYVTVSKNYAVFEYCKDNLQQAAAIAPNPERQAINNTLLTLSNV